MDVHRNRKYWKETGFREWEFNGISKQCSAKPEQQGDFSTDFECHETKEILKPAAYITIGKGYP